MQTPRRRSATPRSLTGPNPDRAPPRHWNNEHSPRPPAPPNIQDTNDPQAARPQKLPQPAAERPPSTKQRHGRHRQPDTVINDVTTARPVQLVGYQMTDLPRHHSRTVRIEKQFPRVSTAGARGEMGFRLPVEGFNTHSFCSRSTVARPELGSTGSCVPKPGLRRATRSLRYLNITPSRFS